MDESLGKLEIEKLKPKVAELIDRLNKEKGLDFNYIAELIGEGGKKISKFYKWKDGKSSPKPNQLINVVEKLEKLLEEPNLEALGNSQLAIINEVNISYTKKKPGLQSMFLHSDGQTITYTGNPTKLGRVIDVSEKKAFIIYVKDSTKLVVTEAMIFIHDDSMAPLINRGSIIAIKKINININDFKPGFTYCVIDSTYQVHLRKLFIENETKVRLVAQNEINYPHFKLELDQILAIFRVEEAVNINP